MADEDVPRVDYFRVDKQILPKLCLHLWGVETTSEMYSLCCFSVHEWWNVMRHSSYELRMVAIIEGSKSHASTPDQETDQCMS